MEKILDLNDIWKYPICEDFITEDYNKENFYWFDKEKYIFIKNEDFTEEMSSQLWIRYIKLFQFDPESMYEHYVKRFNEPRVTKYFSSAKNIEDACIRYILFDEWNCYTFSFHGEYDMYLAITEKLIYWCKQNHIKYFFNKKEPPKDYLFTDDYIKNTYWQIPREESIY